jgi:O-antigen biosynthesis protein WbqP
VKRLFDILGSIAGLVVFGLPMIVLIGLIRRGSPGSPIFAQRRIGRHGAEFTCYKLRTMVVGTANLPSHMVSNTALTPLGTHLRKWKLDELPQLYNVLRGEMSFVGPRPCLPTQTELIEARRRLGVLDMVPGITGVAQIRGIDMSQPELLASVDAEYRKDAGLLFDIKLIIATLLGKGVGVDRVTT